MWYIQIIGFKHCDVTCELTEGYGIHRQGKMRRAKETGMWKGWVSNIGEKREGGKCTEGVKERGWGLSYKINNCHWI